MCDMVSLKHKKKDAHSASISGKVHAFFKQSTRVRTRLLPNFFSPFSYRIGKAFISTKLQEIIKKLKIKVSGRVRIDALLTQ